MDSSGSAPHLPRLPFPWFLQGGLIAGILGALINNGYSWVYTHQTGVSYPTLVNMGTITLLCLASALVAAYAYYRLTRTTPVATKVYILLTVLLTLISLGGPLANHPPEEGSGTHTFATLALPMHLIAGLLLIGFIPWYVRRAQNKVHPL